MLMLLMIVLNMIITIGLLCMARRSSGRLIQAIQFVSYLIIGSGAVVGDTHITLIARLSNSGSGISPILVPGGRSIDGLHSVHIFWVWQGLVVQKVYSCSEPLKWVSVEVLQETFCSVRRILTPRRALDLIHRFLLPVGRPRLRFVGEGLDI